MQALKAEIFATIMDFYATGEAVMSDEPIVTVRCFVSNCVSLSLWLTSLLTTVVVDIIRTGHDGAAG